MTYHIMFIPTHHNHWIVIEYPVAMLPINAFAVMITKIESGVYFNSI